MDKAHWFREYMRGTAANYNEVGDLCADQVVTASGIIAAVFATKNRLLLAGNGVDASLCDIIASRFTSRLNWRSPRPGWPAMSLASSTNFLTGHSAQFGVDEVYSRLVSALGARGDVFMAIESGEGQENIAWGLRKAEMIGLHTIALVGFTSKLAKLADVVIRVPLKDQQRINEVHMAIQNALCFLVEQELSQ